MPSLQIRDLPSHLYRMLADKAQRNRRSLAQQATVELERMAEAERRNRRIETVASLRLAAAKNGVQETTISPVDAVREDRDR